MRRAWTNGVTAVLILAAGALAVFGIDWSRSSTVERLHLLAELVYFCVLAWWVPRGFASWRSRGYPWWPGGDPHNLHGLAAVATGLAAAAAWIVAVVALPMCLLSVTVGAGGAAGWWALAGLAGLCLGTLTTRSSVRLQDLANERDRRSLG